MSGASKTAYDITVGGTTASSDGRKGDRLLLSLVVELGMDSAGGRCVLELAGAAQTPAQPGDSVSVQLDAGDGAVTVFTGTAYAGETTAVSQVVRAADGGAKLAAIEIEQAYEDVTADFIIKDLIGKAGATPGTISAGPDLASYAVHAGTSALAHIRTLAALTGGDFYTDGDGKVHVAAPGEGGADATLSFGETILALDIRGVSPAFDGFEMWGEGAASSQGKDKAHWLSTDLAGVKGEASVAADGSVQAGNAGTSPRRIRAGAIRAGEAAGDAAKAKAAALAGRRLRGTIDAFGSPSLMPGSLLGIAKLPADHAAAALLNGKPVRVRAVRHTLSRNLGLRTRIEV
nr:hypothetical protein [uncultured Rhodopila sp.]